MQTKMDQINVYLWKCAQGKGTAAKTGGIFTPPSLYDVLVPNLMEVYQGLKPRILVCAPSNAAVEELFQRLSAPSSSSAGESNSNANKFVDGMGALYR